MLGAAGVGLVQANYSNNDDGESFTALIRTYAVYRICSFPSLVDAAPGILATIMKIPVVNWVAGAAIRVTFFDQVC